MIRVTVHGLVTLHLSGGFMGLGIEGTAEQLVEQAFAVMVRDSA